MFFAFIGAIFFIGGIILASNFKGAAHMLFRYYSQRTRTGTASPNTLRLVGAFWIPFGAVFLFIGIVLRPPV